MKKVNTAPVSGMQELLPREQAIFERLKSQISAVFAGRGFARVEAPAIERTEILLAKAGGDTEKQIYKLIKTTESAEDSRQALAFDHTVSLARYVVEHENSLAFPFRVAQIGKCYRGERAQRGRFREFYQCDADIIGRGALPLEYDAEVIATLATAVRTMGLPGVRLRISNRKILSGLLAELNLENLSAEIFHIVDRAEKVPRETTVASLEELGIGSENVVRITTFTEVRGDRKTVVERLRGFGFANETFLAGVDELDRVLELLELQGFGDIATADMVIVRGLDYYTGTVFETFLDGYPEIGSVCSGGRYENLASNYTDQVLPGVGGSIGLTRLFYVLGEAGLLKADSEAQVEVAIIPFEKAQYAAAFRLADRLRAEGKSAEVVFGAKRLGDKMAYAAKIARFACVLGSSELAAGSASLKDLVSGATTQISL